MQKLLPLLLVLLNAFAAQSQLTITLSSVPANTPANATIYVAGNFNNWAAGDPAYALSPVGNGQYAITINPPAGTLEFKFTRGSWATVEGNASGGFLPNRTYAYSGQTSSLTLNIAGWEDLGSGGSGTAADNVYILDNDFYIPQLDRTRKIWIYLPPDYANSGKNYPVLYMHDGQNLFDANTSFSGEWEVDESLNLLHQQGDYGCIVVGIDNGGSHRLDEYSPWINTRYGGGEGELYVDFIVNTLKPHIDSLYRTLPGRQSTGIMGSSMGGLISMYALMEHQDVFSKAGIFSSAFWFAGDEPVNHVTSTGKQANARVYFLAGGDEPAYVAQDMYNVANAMLNAGFGPNEQFLLVPSDGEHSEWFWRREFPAAYVWLFADAVSATKTVKKLAPLKVFPNPAGDWVRFENTGKKEKIEVQIFGNDGKLWRDTTVTGNAPVWTGDLPAGFYNVRIHSAKGPWLSGKLVKE